MMESSLEGGAAGRPAVWRRVELDGWAALRFAVVAAGLLSASLFIVVGLTWNLQLYGDGAIFSYAVALRDSWSIHWHNIVGRTAVYLAACLPAELLVGWTGNAHAGIALYGLLFFSAQLVGLVATFAADRSRDRVMVTSACLSTACLCPLVFGFPTEMWFAHALFWPFLALVHFPPAGRRGVMTVLIAAAALVHTHGGGAVLAALAVLTTALRRPDGTMRRALAAFAPAMAIWAVLQASVRPDDQISPILARAAFDFIDPRNLLKPVVGLLLLAVIGPFAVHLLLRSTRFARSSVIASASIAAMLVLYWTRLDGSILVADRYVLRTALFYGTPVFGIFAVVLCLQREGKLREALAWMPPADRLCGHRSVAGLAIGALGLVALVHAVETAKFLDGWSTYTDRLRALSAAAASPPDAPLLSSSVIPAELNAFAWSSTTPYLSVVATPDLNPARLVISPYEGYHWISCERARRHAGEAAVPKPARDLVERHACTGK